MARPGQLSDAVARLFGIPARTVRQQARDLRDAGLVAKERQGRGAGQMASRDAAHLLLAAAKSSSPRGGIEAIDRPGGFISARQWRLRFLPVPELRSLPQDHSL